MYNKLNTRTKKWLEFYRQYKKPISTRGASLLIPLDIAHAYRTIAKQSLAIMHTDKDSISMDTGGSSNMFLRAIMETNDIPYTTYNIDDEQNLKQQYIEINDKKQKEKVNYCIVHFIVKSSETFHSLFENIVMIYKNLLGGFINVLIKDEDSVLHGHTLMFTVCKRRPIICNYGTCVGNINDLEDEKDIHKWKEMYLLI